MSKKTRKIVTWTMLLVMVGSVLAMTLAYFIK